MHLSRHLPGVLAALTLGVFAAPALADAPDPIPAATTGKVTVNPDGSRTLSVSGRWQWPTHGSDCNNDRSGAGFAVDWNDPTDPGNLVQGKKPLPDIFVGTAADNTVHSTPQTVAGRAAAHDVSDPSMFGAWLGGCGVYTPHNNVTLPDGTVKSGNWNEGTWGPIEHRYPASVTGPISICPIMYDVHGKQTGTAPNGAKEITAGGKDLNGDNSYQDNANTPQGNGCFKTTFNTPALDVVKTAAEPAVHVGDLIHYTITVTNTGDADLTVTPSDLGCDGFDNTAFALAVGASKTLTCVHAATASDGTSYTNTACASGTDANGTAVSDCDTVHTPIDHPALTVKKTVDKSTANVGDTLNYTIVVTNTGDVDLTVTPSDTGCTGFDATAFTLAVGASKTLTCTHTTAAAEGQSYTNKACASGVDPIGGTVSACGDVTTQVPNGDQLVLPSRNTPGTARLLGPTGCVSKVFSARVRGTKVAKVTFTLDGKVVKRYTKTIKSGIYALRVNPAKYRIGVHRLVAKITFAKGSGTKAKTLRLSFQRCAHKLTAPRFTG